MTHEQEEAFDVGDRVALLESGSLAQVGPPEELYLRPQSRFVAAFVGRASVLMGESEADGEVQIGDDRFRGHGVRWPADVAVPVEPGQPGGSRLQTRGACVWLPPMTAGHAGGGDRGAPVHR